MVKEMTDREGRRRNRIEVGNGRGITFDLGGLKVVRHLRLEALTLQDREPRPVLDERQLIRIPATTHSVGFGTV